MSEATTEQDRPALPSPAHYRVIREGLAQRMRQQGTYWILQGQFNDNDRMRDMGRAYQHAASMLETETIEDLAPLLVLLLETGNPDFAKEVLPVMKVRHLRSPRELELLRKCDKIASVLQGDTGA